MINITLIRVDSTSYEAYAETEQSTDSLVFFSVGEEDNIQTAIDKNSNKDCHCTIGKSSSIEINSLNIQNGKLLSKIEEIMKIDKDLLQWGSLFEMEEMSIDVLHCVSKTDTIFNYWDYYFSNKTKELLSILVVSKINDSIYEQLFLKHGPCIKNDFCEKNDNLLFIVNDTKEKMFIIILYTKNIILHHEILETEQLNKKKKEEKQLKEAF